MLSSFELFYNAVNSFQLQSTNPLIKRIHKIKIFWSRGKCTPTIRIALKYI